MAKHTQQMEIKLFLTAISFLFVPKTPVALSETHGIDAVNASKKGKKSPLITVSTAKTL